MFLFRWGSNSKDFPSNPPPALSSSPPSRAGVEATTLVRSPSSSDEPQESKAAVDSALDRPGPLTPSLKIFLGGVSFFLLSTVVTRRALRRRRLASVPPFYTSSTYHQPHVNGAIEAFEALNIATVNVVSLAMIAVGGTLYGLDINSIDEMRRLVRGGASVDGAAKSEKELEEELEEWVAGVLDRKEKRKQTGIEELARNKSNE